VKLLPHSLVFVAGLLAITSTSGISAAPSPASPALARDFVQALQSASMDAFAASDPTQSGRFVAALYVPGQLLVVSATHPSHDLVEQRINAGLYRDVYLDLQGTPTVAGKVFVQDTGADGLVNAAPNSGAVDVLYENGSLAARFDGNPKAQGRTAQDYDERFAKADADYSHALTVLKSAFEARGER
jgi:hypothetical protein